MDLALAWALLSITIESPELGHHHQGVPGHCLWLLEPGSQEQGTAVVAGTCPTLEIWSDLDPSCDPRPASHPLGTERWLAVGTALSVGGRGILVCGPLPAGHPHLGGGGARGHGRLSCRRWYVAMVIRRPPVGPLTASQPPPFPAGRTDPETFYPSRPSLLRRQESVPELNQRFPATAARPSCHTPGLSKSRSRVAQPPPLLQTLPAVLPCPLPGSPGWTKAPLWSLTQRSEEGIDFSPSFLRME